jgi:hypothetical protein
MIEFKGQYFFLVLTGIYNKSQNPLRKKMKMDAITAAACGVSFIKHSQLLYVICVDFEFLHNFSIHKCKT